MSSPTNVVYNGAFNALLKKYCFSEDNFAVFPELAETNVNVDDSPRINLTVSTIAKDQFIPLLAMFIRDDRPDDEIRRYHADTEMRYYMGSIRARYSLSSRFHGISLFGTRMRLYTLDGTMSKSQILPPPTPLPSTVANIPDNYLGREWDLDIATPDGCLAFLDIVADIKKWHAVNMDHSPHWS